MLTGRNHHRVGNGQITELANDWDGYSGIIPKTSATVAEVLKNYGYATSAFGKWHNTPSNETTAAGPFDYWPTGYGFEYFYGFLAGEASQYEPHLVRNTTVVHPNPPAPGKKYHLSEDLADDAINWLRNQKAFQPDKPFFMYWASGASHGPHHVTKEWADKYKGKFDDGWDKYRERVFARAKKLDWIPQDAQLTPRPATLAAWDSIPESEKPFQRRLMEVFAGFTEHVDVQVGRIVDEIERLGHGDNTLIFYIWGDNGSSAEGQNGSISELLAQNGIPTTIEAAHRCAERARRARRARLAEDRQHVSRRLGLGGQHALQAHQARRLALRRHPQPDGGALARQDQARRGGAPAVPPRQRHRPDHLRGRRHHAAERRERHPARPVRRHEPRLRVRRRQGAGAQAHPVLRDHGQPRHLSRRLDGVGIRSAHALAARASRRASSEWTPDKDQWELYNLERGLVAGQRSRRARCRRSSKS